METESHNLIEQDKFPKEQNKKGPIFYIIAFFILFLITISIIPYYAIKEDPIPKEFPKIEDVYFNPAPATINVSKNQNNNIISGYNNYLMPNDPIVKQTSTKIATFGCDSNSKMNIVCQAKAEFYFVRNNFIYVSEYDDYFQTPQEMLSTKGGDCDDHAILLANLMRGIGIHTRFVQVPRHVFIQIYLPEAKSKYKTKDGWINLDPTCKDCEFGELAREFQDSVKTYS